MAWSSRKSAVDGRIGELKGVDYAEKGEQIAMSHTIFGFNCAICLRLFDSLVRSFHLA